LVNDGSKVTRAGPMMVLRPRLPRRPTGGSRNTFGSKSWVELTLGTLSTPGARSGRCSLSVVASRSWSNVKMGVTGIPERAVKMPLSCQLVSLSTEPR
jgi:hypothetical protein